MPATDPTPLADPLAATAWLLPFNTLVVLAGTMLLGVACGVVGVFTVLRGRALVADGIAHAALPGVCVAFLVFATKELSHLLLGALAFALLSLATLALLRRHRLVREDAAIALTLSVFFGLGTVLLSVAQRSQDSKQAGLEGFIFGKAAGMLTSDVAMLAIVAGVVVVVCGLLHRQLRVLCFDRAFGDAAGMKMGRIDAVLMLLVCVATVAALPAVGLVLVVAMLTIPPATARLWTNRLGVMVALSAAFAAASAAIGTLLSALVAKLSAGPLITLCAAAIFTLSVLFAPRAGVVTQWARGLLMQRRVALQNLLRAIYEVAEPAGPATPVAFAQIQPKRAWSPAQLHAVLARAARLGLVERAASSVTLTPRGALEAQRLVRAHRVWELYLIEQAAIASDHVDRDADAVEHVLPEGVRVQLEERLRALGRLPGEAGRRPPPFAARGGGREQRGGARVTLLAAITTPTPSEWWMLAVASLCGAACALCGCYLVLRKMSLLGDAITHAILPGLAGAFLLTGTRNVAAMLAGAMVVGLLTAGLASWLARRVRVAGDAALGAVFTSMFALGVILISQAASGVDLDPGCVLYGLLEFVGVDRVAVLGVEVPRALLPLAIMFVVLVAVVLVLGRPLTLVAFDAGLAATIGGLGLGAAALHYLAVALVAATSVVSFEAVGSILVVAMLVGPAMAARLWTDRLTVMVALSVVLGVVSAGLGGLAAIWMNVSAAGAIACAVGVVFTASLLVSPRHGAIVALLRRAQLTLRVHEEDILGALYRVHEKSLWRKPEDDCEPAPALHASLWLVPEALGAVRQHASSPRGLDHQHQHADTSGRAAGRGAIAGAPLVGVVSREGPQPRDRPPARAGRANRALHRRCAGRKARRRSRDERGPAGQADPAASDKR